MLPESHVVLAALPESPELAEWFATPGARWGPGVRARVTEWLNRDPCRAILVRGAERILRRALRDLSYADDAEEVWQEYTAGRLDGDLAKYDPEKGRRFETFLPLWFGFFCWERAGVLGAQRGRLVDLAEAPPARPGGAQARGVVVVATTSASADELSRVLDLVETMRACLTPLELDVVLRHNVEGYRFAEIARTIGKSELATRLLHHRAKLHLRHHLRALGYGV
jgi:hypothetical protein